ncbi:MAG: VWA domain-containing protein [archaeon]
MIQISFLYPKLLLLLFSIPIFILIYFLGGLYNKRRSIVFPNFEAMKRVSGGEIFSRNFIILYINLIILSFLVLGIAGMTISLDVKSSSFTYVFAIDRSESMATTDVLPNRLEAAKSFAGNFVDKLPLVEIGVIGFSGDAMIMQELDASKLKTKLAIDSVNFGEVEGTNIYNAVIGANEIFGTERMKSLILITDGQSNVDGVDKIINYANKRNIIINTVAVGTVEGGESNLGVISKLNEDFLKALAFNTQGRFFSAQDAEALDEVLFEFEKISTNVSLNISIYLLIGSLILFLLNWVLYNFRFKTIP